MPGEKEWKNPNEVYKTVEYNIIFFSVQVALALTLCCKGKASTAGERNREEKKSKKKKKEKKNTIFIVLILSVMFMNPLSE